MADTKSARQLCIIYQQQHRRQKTQLKTTVCKKTHLLPVVPRTLPGTHLFLFLVLFFLQISKHAVYEWKWNLKINDLFKRILQLNQNEIVTKKKLFLHLVLNTLLCIFKSSRSKLNFHFKVQAKPGCSLVDRGDTARKQWKLTTVVRRCHHNHQMITVCKHLSRMTGMK